MKLPGIVYVVILASVLVVAGCSAPAPVDSGIRGIVTLGPTDGAQLLDASAEKVPFEAELIIKPQGGRSSVARVKSGSDGRFSATLEPGTYVIRAASTSETSALTPVTVTVAAHEYVEVAVPFVGGIR